MRAKAPLVVDGVELWQCPRCGDHLPSSSFYPCKRSPNGLKAQCRSCHLEGAVRTRDPDNTRRLGREHMRRARVADPDRFREREREASRRRPTDQHVLARRALNAAVRRGELVRPDRCSRCGEPGKIQGHHPDHSQPLEVIWLCPVCHGAEERAA